MILVVEDEPGIVDFIERGLRRSDFEVTSAGDGKTGLERALGLDIDLVVLDLMLPQLSGEEVLTTLRRERPELPVIVLTARGEVEDRVAGLNAGAVDYLVKPFALDELVARVRAQLRSTRRGDTVMNAGGLSVDLLRRTVSAGESTLRLSTTEFELLVHLMTHSGEVLARDQILRAVWGYQHDPGTNLLDVYVGYVRRKLREVDVPATIVTVRGLGYRFDEEPR